MKVQGFDIETFLITNSIAPEPVCVSFCDGSLMSPRDAVQHIIKLLDDDYYLVAHNANFDLISLCVYDYQLFHKLFYAMKSGKILCTKLAEILINTADPATDGKSRGTVYINRGTEDAPFWKPVTSNSLAGVAYKYLNVDLTAEKESGIRTGYGDLIDVPIDQWDDAVKKYAIDDAIYCKQVLEAQIQRAKELPYDVNVLSDLARQTLAEFILQFCSTVLGVKVDLEFINEAQIELMLQHDEAIQTALQYDLMKVNKSAERGYSTNTTRLQAVVQRAIDLCGIEHATTKSGKLSTSALNMQTLDEAIDFVLSHKRNLDHKIKLSKDDLLELASIQSALKSMQESNKLWKSKHTFLDALAHANLNQDSRLRYNYNGLMETGRTSSKNPNLQNIPRKGKARECIKPASGNIFIIADYSNAELRTLAQAHINENRYSELAIRYQNDKYFDPHLYAGAQMYGVTYEQAIILYENSDKKLSELRQLAKIANFGYAGGLGAEQFIDYAKGYGVNLTLDESEKLRNDWLDVWQEMNDYFSMRANMMIDAEADLLEQIQYNVKNKTRKKRTIYTEDYNRICTFKSSNRVRYLRKFTIGCNTPFQGIASDGAKEALILVFEHCFFKPDSALYRCKPVLFIHDEIVIESPDDDNHTARADLLSELMVQGMQKHTPDIPAVAEACASKLWVKDAKSTRLPNGKITIYDKPAK